VTEDSGGTAESIDPPFGGMTTSFPAGGPSIPAYLQETYWWAYLHPKAIRVFEREWLVNLILWGNMRRLTGLVLDQMAHLTSANVLQLACVYGDFSRRLACCLEATKSQLHVVDIAPIQLNNVRQKLSGLDNFSLHHQDSSELRFRSQLFDRSVLFFLLHEQPEDVRKKSIAEAIRVTRPGGTVIIVDYHGPHRSNPLRYVMYPILKRLEPFAMDLWHTSLVDYLPPYVKRSQLSHRLFFGGLYQQAIIRV